MSTFTNSKAGNIVRGGQTTIHFIRMIGQVFKQFVTLSILLGCLTYVSFLSLKTDVQQKQLAWDYTRAWLHSELFKDHKAVVEFHLPDGSTRPVTAISLINNQGIQRQMNDISDIAYSTIYYALFMLIVIAYLLIRFIYTAGQGHKKDEHIRGGLLVDSDQLNKALADWRNDNQEPNGKMALLDITLPKKFEPAHMLIAGDPGTGKSNLLRKSLTSIREAGQRAIIYDRSGDFVKNFYRPGIDKILNPLDSRSAQWDIFKECQKEHEFYQLALSFIPEVKTSDPFWTAAARIIFASMAIKESHNLLPSIDQLVYNMLNLPLDEMIEHCQDTDAQAIVTEGGEKMAISIRGVLVTYVRALKYLNSDTVESFSINQWTQDDSTDSWIFITSNKSIHETIKPLITSWLDIATSSILSLEPNQDRRIWLVIDELPTLNKIPSIQTTPAESRKYGGCFIIGFQNYPQLLDIYGKNGTDALCGSCSTAVIFRCNEPSFAEWASKQLGRAEIIETSESISYGVNEIRDGVNLGKQRKERAIVLPTELQNLPDLQGYIKLGRGFPVAKFTDQWQHHDEIAKGYIEVEQPLKPHQPTVVEPQEPIQKTSPLIKDTWKVNTAVTLNPPLAQTTPVPQNTDNGFIRNKLKPTGQGGDSRSNQTQVSDSMNIEME
jgi:type IV conjugative transfer system coupling protein TraD